VDEGVTHGAESPLSRTRFTVSYSDSRDSAHWPEFQWG
jgi:hypothetical protein